MDAWDVAVYAVAVYAAVHCLVILMRRYRDQVTYQIIAREGRRRRSAKDKKSSGPTAGSSDDGSSNGENS